MANLIIKELCKQKGITQRELAERIGLTPVGLAKAIGGNTTITTLEKIADGLGVSVPELFQQNDIHITCPKCGAQIKIKAE